MTAASRIPGFSKTVRIGSTVTLAALLALAGVSATPALAVPLDPQSSLNTAPAPVFDPFTSLPVTTDTAGESETAAGALLRTSTAQAEQPADGEEPATEEPGEDAPAGEGGEGTADGEDGTAEDGTAEDGAAEDGAAEDGEEGTEEGEEADRFAAVRPILDLVEAGGPIIVILALLSVISLAIVIVKLIQFSRMRVGRPRWLEPIVELVRQGRIDEAFERVEATPGVVARVTEAALRGKRLGPEADDITREEVTRVAQAKLEGLSSGLTLLSLIATISPLLGLLGTVLGMIDAFQQLQGAGDRVDPAILSGGIWEALLTTAAGLTVAIPAAAFYTWLQRTVDVTAQAMEDAATQCFTSVLYVPTTPSQPGGGDPVGATA